MVLIDVAVDEPDEFLLALRLVSVMIDDDTTEFSVETMLWWFDVFKLSTALARRIKPVSDCSKGAWGGGGDESDILIGRYFYFTRETKRGD